jgi:hypothetical protein
MPHFDFLLPDARPVHIRVNDRALTISIDELSVYTFDLAGRLFGLFDHGINYRRGLDGRILARWREKQGQRARRWLSPEARDALMVTVQQALKQLQAAIPAAAGPPLHPLLQRAINFDHQADAHEFAHVYRPVSILPPDQYQALVLQATEGCSFNTCTFCTLYRDRPFKIQSPASFARHLDEVRAFFGPGITLRRSLFLADANALIIPQKRLLPLMQQLARAFRIMPAGLDAPARRAWQTAHPQGMTGLYAFVDGLSAERKSAEDFRELRALGLRRVYIGLESGHEPLLAWLQKPSSAAEMAQAVGHMKQAGLAVGVIVLLGAGGEPFDAGHVQDTAAILNAMPLDATDIIYLSPFQPDIGAPYLALAQEAGIALPTPQLIAAQRQRLLAALRLPEPPAGPKRVPYNLADFVY